MAGTKTHPHFESPGEARIRTLLAGRDPKVQDTYLAVHHLVLDIMPGIRFSIDTVDGAMGYAERQYGYGGWGMAALLPAKGWVNLVIMRGVELDDPDAVLEGKGKTMRGIRFRSPEAVTEKAEAVRRFILAASRLPD